MIAAKFDPLEKLVRDAGESWLIDRQVAGDDSLAELRQLLRDTHAEAVKRIGAQAPAMSAESLSDAWRQNPHKVKAFLQAAGSISSPEMLLMAWRILQGLDIVSIKMEYVAAREFLLSVMLSEAGGVKEFYETRNVDDAAVLRHLGIIRMENESHFDGFYAFK